MDKGKLLFSGIFLTMLSLYVVNVSTDIVAVIALIISGFLFLLLVLR